MIRHTYQVTMKVENKFDVSVHQQKALRTNRVGGGGGGGGG